jgi:hypothetical protein
MGNAADAIHIGSPWLQHPEIRGLLRARDAWRVSIMAV